MSFRPVHRASKEASAEPNDEAITKHIRNMSKLQASNIAILTEDADFIDAVLDLRMSSTNITVTALIPENLFGDLWCNKKVPTARSGSAASSASTTCSMHNGQGNPS